MTIFTSNPPSTNSAENERLGYAYPTRWLMPPYLTNNEYFVDFADTIDEVFDDLVFSKGNALKNIRNVWAGNPELEQSIINGDILDYNLWSIPEHELLMKQVNMLGLKISQAGSIPHAAYLAITRFLGMYWFEKGKAACMDFISFCLGTDLELKQLWTEDYIHFHPIDDNLVGTPVWEGGTWYPTSHVAIVADKGLPPTVDIQSLASLFNDISNYNLVLWSIDNNYRLNVGTHDSRIAKIVAMALLANNALVVSNTNRYGAAPPPLNTFDWVTTQFWASQIIGTNISYYLGQASGWILYQGNKRIPVYMEKYRTVEFTETLPTKAYGDGKILCGDIIGWVPVPGSGWSESMIPIYKPSMYVDHGFNVDLKTEIRWSKAALDEKLSREDYDVIEKLHVDTVFSMQNGNLIMTSPEDTDITGTEPTLVEAGHHIEYVANALDKIPQFLGIFRYLRGIHTKNYIGVSPIPLSTPDGFVEIYDNCWAPYWNI